MQFSTVTHLEKRKKGDMLVFPFWQEKKGPKGAASLGPFSKTVKGILSSGDFKGAEGEILIAYHEGKKEPRIVLLGLGEEKTATVEQLRRAYSNLTKACHQRKLKKIALVLPEGKLEGGECVRGIAEGILLTNYAFESLKSTPAKERAVMLTEVTVVGATSKMTTILKECDTIAEGIYFARDLINGNADDVTPQVLAKAAKGIAKKCTQVKATVFDKKRIEKEKMGLLLAVNKGSHIDPVFIILEYTGHSKSKEKTVVVGKGITYDTGGLCLKRVGGSMEEMKADMSGGAMALASVYVAAKLSLKVNLTAVVPATENAIGTRSYKPGDVYTSYSGKTVEIGNTDAEGRLVLADGLAYACKHLNPTRLLDFATLTGSVVVALGEETAGLMTNDDALAEGLVKAGEQTYERVWRLPLFEEYGQQLKSGVADLGNVGGRAAGAIVAGKFLQEFVDPKVPWAHCDIAGTAFLTKARRYHPQYGTGAGIRLLIQFLQNVSK